jgi:hypothetical protein
LAERVHRLSDKLAGHQLSFHPVRQPLFIVCPSHVDTDKRQIFTFFIF